MSMKKFSVFTINKELSAEHVINSVFKEDHLFKGILESQQIFADGFINYTDSNTDVEQQQYVQVENLLAIKLKTVEKSIPSAYVKEKVAEEIKNVESREHRKVGRKEKHDIKQSIIDSLLPHAFQKANIIEMIFDFNNHYLFVNSTSDKVLDYTISKLIDAFKDVPNLEAQPLSFDSDSLFGMIMKNKIIEDWFDSSSNDTELTLDNSCMIEVFQSESVSPNIRVKDIDLQSEDILNLLRDGCRLVSSINLKLGENISFTVNEKLKFSNMKNANADVKFDSNEETIQQFNESKLLLETQGMADVVHAVLAMLSSSERK